MKNIFKKTITIIFLTFILIGFTAPVYYISAQGTSPKYQLLAPLPCQIGTPGCDNNGKLTTFDPSVTNKAGENSKFGEYLNIMIRLFIGICAVLAVIMIVVGGIEYMTSELPGNKGHGKETIMNAIFGLLLALGSWLILFTINPDLLKSDLSSLKQQTVNVTLEDQIKSYTGKGTCTPISFGLCSPAFLKATGFLPEPPRATQASSICNGESGGNSAQESGVDKCSDGNSFSFGLFQINAIAHANEIPGGVCSGVFTTNGGGTQGACLQSQNGICIKHDCRVVNQTKFESCKSYLKNPIANISYAIRLQASGGWNQWGANASCNF